MGWLDLVFVRFEIVKCTQFRELAFLKPVNVRALNLYRVDGMARILDLVNYKNKQSNMYISNATLSEIPQFTYNIANRQKETSEWFRTAYFKGVVAYDIFCDFDLEENEGWEGILKEINDFLSFFREYKVPYQTIFSGRRGVQIIIPYEYLPQELTFDVGNTGKGEENSIYDWTK